VIWRHAYTARDLSYQMPLLKKVERNFGSYGIALLGKGRAVCSQPATQGALAAEQLAGDLTFGQPGTASPALQSFPDL
jgi:hypothetical protein